MEHQSLAHWLTPEAQSLLVGALCDPEGDRLLSQAVSRPPDTRETWQHLFRRCACYGAAPLLEAVLDAAPEAAFEQFEFVGIRAPLDDGCFALIADRLWSRRLPSLKLLRVHDATLSRDSVRRIAEIVRQSTVLEELVLITCGLDGDAASELWSAMLDSKCPLNHLSLPFNPIGDALVRALAQGRYPKQLSNLNLGGVGLGPEDAIGLASALKGWKTLKTLTLEGNPIGDRAGAAVLEAALDHPGLETINLESCSLGASSASAFVELVARTGPVCCLVMSDNDFSALPQGIGAALKGNGQLRFLYLSNVGLSAASASDLLRGLAGPRCVLQMLDLANNALTSLDASPLASNTSLEQLDLEGNDLPTATYAALANALAAHPKLERLNLEIDSRGNDSIERLAEGIARNRSLKELTLLGPQILTNDQMNALVRAVEHHPSLKLMYVPCDFFDNPELQSLLEALLRRNLVLTDVMGTDFDWYPGSGAPEPFDRYLARNDRALDVDLIKALHDLIEKSVVLLGFDKLYRDLRREIALTWIGRTRVKSVKALRDALRLRLINQALGSMPLPAPRREH